MACEPIGALYIVKISGDGGTGLINGVVPHVQFPCNVVPVAVQASSVGSGYPGAIPYGYGIAKANVFIHDLPPKCWARIYVYGIYVRQLWTTQGLGTQFHNITPILLVLYNG